MKNTKLKNKMKKVIATIMMMHLLLTVVSVSSSECAELSDTVIEEICKL